VNDSSGPPDDRGGKGAEPPVQKEPISRSSGVQSEEAVQGGEPTESEAGTEPESPHGAGESVTRSGEESADRTAEETKGVSGRPYGKRAGAGDSGVAPSEPIDEESPDLPPGDQGG
jgi:hypothetical protein